MPSRLSSTKNFWIALVSSAVSRARSVPAAGVAGPADLAQAVAVPESLAGLRQIEIARRHRAASSPSAARRTVICAAFSSSVMRREEVGHALVDREGRVQVRRRLRSLDRA